MTNGEKYKTVEARSMAFRKFCAGKICKGERGKANCIFSDKIHDVCTHKCEFAWLDLEYEEELLPCPFCGGVPKVVAWGNGSGVTCTCGAGIYKVEKATAIEAWNRRVK